MSICQIEEKLAGRPYPRTCPTCGILGGCVKNLEQAKLAERVKELEIRCYELAYAITGGEDAPGYIDSIPTKVLVKYAKDMHRKISELEHTVYPIVAIDSVCSVCGIHVRNGTIGYCCSNIKCPTKTVSY